MRSAERTNGRFGSRKRGHPGVKEERCWSVAGGCRIDIVTKEDE